MPSGHKRQRSKATRFAVPGKPKKSLRITADRSSTDLNGVRATAATGGSHANGELEKNSKGVPAPVAVLMRALGLVVKASDDTDDKGENSSALLTSSIEVEVETNQGYVYTGKLVHIDARYNVILHEALVRRARSFDVERAILREKSQREAQLIASSLQGVVAEEAEVVRSTNEFMPRPRYIGVTYLRSNNIFFMRFIDGAARTGTSAASAVSTHSALGRLRSEFVVMAAAIKAHLQREKMRNRAARRKRLEAKKMTGGSGGSR